MSQSALADLVLRVADGHSRRGDLDAALLDAAGVVLGTGGLSRLVAALAAEGALPGVLAGLAEVQGRRRLAAAVAALADRGASRSITVQLERARRHLTLLGHADASQVAAERDQLIEDLVAGRELP